MTIRSMKVKLAIFICLKDALALRTKELNCSQTLCSRHDNVNRTATETIGRHTVLGTGREELSREAQEKDSEQL